MPTGIVSDPPAVHEVLDVDNYKSCLSAYITDAWELSQANVQQAQRQQKLAYDRHVRPQVFKPGDRVFVFMPGAKQNKAYKFAQAFHGPYRVKKVVETSIVVLPVDRPTQEPIMDRVRRCPRQIQDTFWPSKMKTSATEVESRSTTSPAPNSQTVWSGCLHSRPRTSYRRVGKCREPNF